MILIYAGSDNHSGVCGIGTINSDVRHRHGCATGSIKRITAIDIVINRNKGQKDSIEITDINGDGGGKPGQHGVEIDLYVGNATNR